MKIFQHIRSFLGIASTATKMELTEDQIEKIDASLGELSVITAERDAIKTRVTELEATATADKEVITGLQGQVTTLTEAKTAAEAEVVKQKAEVERLGKLDAGAFTKVTSQEEKKDAETVEMSASQKELYEKANEF